MERLARDMGLLAARPNKRLRRLHRIRQLLAARRNRVVPVQARSDNEARVIIIDAATGAVIQEQEEDDG